MRRLLLLFLGSVLFNSCITTPVKDVEQINVLVEDSTECTAGSDNIIVEEMPDSSYRSVDMSFLSKEDYLVIEKNKQKLKNISDDNVNFFFSDDTNLWAQDPNAYWLMNRMMQMYCSVETPEDAWAWLLAMDETVDEYNSRLGRRGGAMDIAMKAIENLISTYCAGNQAEMNTASFVELVIAWFRKMYEYYDFTRLIGEYYNNATLKNLYYQEFRYFFAIHNSMDDIMTSYTYGQAVYSMLSMDLNSQLNVWFDTRLAELKIENSICLSPDFKPFKTDAKSVSNKKFDEFYAYIKTMVTSAGITEKDCNDTIDSETTVSDYCKVVEATKTHKEAMNNWLKVREQIALELPKERQGSYREITKHIHYRLYDNLLELKEQHY